MSISAAGQRLPAASPGATSRAPNGTNIFPTSPTNEHVPTGAPGASLIGGPREDVVCSDRCVAVRRPSGSACLNPGRTGRPRSQDSDLPQGKKFEAVLIPPPITPAEVSAFL